MPPLLEPGQLDLEDLRGFVAKAEEFLGRKRSLECRTVAVWVPNLGWTNFKTLCRLRAVNATGSPEEIIEFPGIRLLRWAAPLDEGPTIPGLIDQVTHWSALTKATTKPNFADQVNAYRHYSGNAWFRGPGWKLDLVPVAPQTSSVGPQGPFFNSRMRLVARSIGELAANWLEDPGLFTNQWGDGSYSILAEDRRGAFEEFRADGNKLAIRLTTVRGGPKRYCTALRVGFRGEREELISKVVRGTAAFEFDGAVRDLDLLVFSEDGECLDSYSEGPSHVRRSPSLYSEPRERFDSEFAALESARRDGEGNGVEFKPWIPVKHEKSAKAKELAITACAFANGQGGDIYIGVNDDTSLVDFSADLNRVYGSKGFPTPETQRDRYAMDVRDYIRSSVDPAPHVQLGWIRVGECDVLRAHISPEADKHCVLLTDGYQYVRRGATSRRASPSEVRGG